MEVRTFEHNDAFAWNFPNFLVKMHFRFWLKHHLLREALPQTKVLPNSQANSPVFLS